MIEDESYLRRVATVHFTKLSITIAILAGIAAAVFIAVLLISFTPLRNLLPGYLKDSERSATEENMMRLDSLALAFEREQAYIRNFMTVIDIDRIPSDSISIKVTNRELTSDSLMGPSLAEQQFVNQMEERERFNISVLAPLAADGIMFSPITDEGIFIEDKKTTTEPVIILPSEESIRSCADGSILSISHSGLSDGYVIMVQYKRGFVISYKGTGAPLVGVGDIVNGGQMLALSPEPDTKGVRKFTVRMWHNGTPILPYDYIGPLSGRKGSIGEVFEAPRGK